MFFIFHKHSQFYNATSLDLFKAYLFSSLEEEEPLEGSTVESGAAVVVVSGATVVVVVFLVFLDDLLLFRVVDALTNKINFSIKNKLLHQNDYKFSV